jgi:hypothetical protein
MTSARPASTQIRQGFAIVAFPVDQRNLLYWNGEATVDRLPLDRQ